MARKCDIFLQIYFTFYLRKFVLQNVYIDFQKIWCRQQKRLQTVVVKPNQLWGFGSVVLVPIALVSSAYLVFLPDQSNEYKSRTISQKSSLLSVRNFSKNRIFNQEAHIQNTYTPCNNPLKPMMVLGSLVGNDCLKRTCGKQQWSHNVFPTEHFHVTSTADNLRWHYTCRYTYVVKQDYIHYTNYEHKRIKNRKRTQVTLISKSLLTRTNCLNPETCQF